MKLWEYVDKNVRLILEDGTSIKGRVVDWFDGYDLDGPDEIVIGDRSLSRKSKLLVLSSTQAILSTNYKKYKNYRKNSREENK